MSKENRLKARTVKNDLLIGILTQHLSIEGVSKLLEENKYKEACKKIDKHYGV